MAHRTMATLTLTIPGRGSAGAPAAAALAAHVYAPATVAVSHGQELTLASPAAPGPVTGLAQIVTHIVKHAPAGSDLARGALGQTDGDAHQVAQWLARLDPGPVDLDELDAHLKTRTYLVSNQLTAADVALFAAVHPDMASADRAKLLSRPNLTRYFDLVQHLPEIASALPNLGLLAPATVPIKLDDVPKAERKAPVKEKKDKAMAESLTPAGAAASTDPKEGKREKKDQQASDGNKKDQKQGKREKKDQKVDQPPKADKSGAGSASAPAVSHAPAPWMIDLRVGRIVDVKKHPDADSLYVEQIDVGEAEPRTVVSGLVNYVPIDQMRDRYLVAVCNLKPVAMRGVKSFAMVLCATSRDGKDGGVELVNVPAGSTPGDKVYFEGFETEVPLEQLNPKKKIFETVQPGFTTLDTKECAWVDPNDKSVIRKIRTAKGVVVAPNFVGASLS